MKLDSVGILSGPFLSPGFDLMQPRNTAGYELTKTAHADLGLCTLPFNVDLAGASKPALSPRPTYAGPPTKPSIWTRNPHQSSWNRAPIVPNTTIMSGPKETPGFMDRAFRAEVSEPQKQLCGKSLHINTDPVEKDPVAAQKPALQARYQQEESHAVNLLPNSARSVLFGPTERPGYELRTAGGPMNPSPVPSAASKSPAHNLYNYESKAPSQASFNAFSQASLPAPSHAISTLGLVPLSYTSASYLLPPYDPTKSSVHPQNAYWSYQYALLFKSPPGQVVAKMLYEHWCNVYETDQDNAEDEFESVCISDDDGNVRYIGNGYSSAPRDSESEYSYDDDITRTTVTSIDSRIHSRFATGHVQDNDNGYFCDSSSECSYDANHMVTTVTSIDTEDDPHFRILSDGNQRSVRFH